VHDAPDSSPVPGSFPGADFAVLQIDTHLGCPDRRRPRRADRGDRPEGVVREPL